MDDKRFFLERLIRENPEDKMLVFVRTKVRAERLKKAMERVGISCETIHGDKTQQERNTVMDDFRKGTVKVLIATDVSARGIDIPNIEIVVNYDLPEQAENYVHRVGRTGRGDKFGKSISFCSIGEKNLLKEIESFITKPITELVVDKQTYKETIKMTADPTQEKLTSLIDEIEKIDEFARKKAKSKKRK